ncbi:NUDIX domain-containing protein [Intrasporangium sp. DVR]|uniref:NUDIX hydrolase n=1 Tax=Intrasporangium sp. DVR TaxID=3127867 RepID=UPI00313A5120
MTASWSPPTASEADPGPSPAAYGLIHRDAVAALTRWAAPDAEQEQLRVDYLLHLQRHDDALSRSGPQAHLTGSVIVLDASGERVLLTLHQKARRWFQFGGHFEADDESMVQGAGREAREESGIDALTVLPEIVMLDRHPLGTAFGRCREHLDVRYAAVAPPEAVPAVSSESVDVRWWPADGLPDDSRDELLPLVRAAQRALRR